MLGKLEESVISFTGERGWKQRLNYERVPKYYGRCEIRLHNLSSCVVNKDVEILRFHNKIKRMKKSWET